MLYVSYSISDLDSANQLVEALKAQGMEVWTPQSLDAGKSWSAQISESIRSSDGIVVVVSEATSTSMEIAREINQAKSLGKLILPVLVGAPDYDRIPSFLLEFQLLRVRRFAPEEFNSVAQTIIETVMRRLAAHLGSPINELALRDYSDAAAEVARALASPLKSPQSTEAPRSVFIVHGHDTDMLNDVVGELKQLSIEAIVMQRVRTADDHLFAKFKNVSKRARHAIVLVSGDDVGAAFRDFDHPVGGAGRLEFRARQNVILELGYFYGKLGEENVFVFQKMPPTSAKVVPKFEVPSDLSGRVFEDFDEDWRDVLLERLRGAGFDV